PTRLKLVSTNPGIFGNFNIVCTTVQTDAIKADGPATGGYDSFGEIVIPHHYDSLNSAIPSDSEYDVSYIRNRYMSRAIPIKVKASVRIFIHGVKAPYDLDVGGNPKIKIRYRIATSTVDWKE